MIKVDRNNKANHYKTIKVLIDAGKIKTFRQIFDYISRRAVYVDLGVNYEKFERIFKHPDLLTLRELVTLSRLIGCELMQLIDLIQNKGRSAR